MKTFQYYLEAAHTIDPKNKLEKWWFRFDPTESECSIEELIQAIEKAGGTNVSHDKISSSEWSKSEVVDFKAPQKLIHEIANKMYDASKFDFNIFNNYRPQVI